MTDQQMNAALPRARIALRWNLVPHPFPARATIAALTALALWFGAWTAHAASPKSKTVSNVLYVQTNDPDEGENAILLYNRGSDGRLTYVASYPTGGTGMANFGQIIGPNDADQDLITNPEHTLLFAVNAGSDSIAVFDIAPNGSLTPVKGSPFPSGGINPVALGLTGNLLYVVNKNQEPRRPNNAAPNYTAFRVAGNGRLTPVPHSTVELPLRDSPTQPLIAPGGDLMFGFELYPEGINNFFGIPGGAFIPSKIESYQILPNGRLQPAPGSPLPVPAYAPPMGSIFDIFTTLPQDYNVAFNGAAHPTLPIIYVNFVTYSQIAVYSYDANGALTFETAVQNTGLAPCWNLISPNGKSMYVLDAFSNTISTYSLANPLNPVEIGVTPLTGTFLAAAAFRQAVDPSSKFLYVIDQNVGNPLTDGAENNIQTFSIAPNGTLTPVPGSTVLLPIDSYARAQGILAL